MAERMAEDGLPIDPDDVLGRLPEGSSPGRPHLGEALQRAGIVADVQEAFARFLDNGGRYYLPKRDTPIREAIDMIGAAGGVTVLAHALVDRGSGVVTDEVIADLAAAGLTGLEVDHPNHDAAARARLRGLAGELGLPVTGSSDYHGNNKRKVAIGQETTDPEMFQALAARATGAELVVG
jgi:predicted metal-dependent phosphoesterase TrpH